MRLQPSSRSRTAARSFGLPPPPAAAGERRQLPLRRVVKASAVEDRGQRIGGTLLGEGLQLRALQLATACMGYSRNGGMRGAAGRTRAARHLPPLAAVCVPGSRAGQPMRPQPTAVTAAAKLGDSLRSLACQRHPPVRPVRGTAPPAAPPPGQRRQRRHALIDGQRSREGSRGRSLRVGAALSEWLWLQRYGCGNIGCRHGVAWHSTAHSSCFHLPKPCSGMHIVTPVLFPTGFHWSPRGRLELVAWGLRA